MRDDSQAKLALIGLSEVDSMALREEDVEVEV